MRHLNYKKGNLMKRYVAFLCFFILNIPVSHAVVIINVIESGGDVVATASGTINTVGLPAPYTTSVPGGYVIGSTSPEMDGFIIVGAGGGVDRYQVSSTAAFNTGNVIFASSNSGSVVGVESRPSGSSLDDYIYVPAGYSSGSQIDATSTWAGQNFSDLGLIPGTYSFTWGSGDNADSLTLIIGGPAPLLTFSNVSYTADSVTFTIDGTMNGYTAPSATQENTFTLVYGGDIWTGTSSFDPSTWSRPIFDNKVQESFSATGGSSVHYTWSRYTTSLADAAVSNATVTVSFSQPDLNVSATSPSISFYWGVNATLLATVTPTLTPSSTPTHTVGGAVSGLTGSVTLQNNGGDGITRTTNDGFTFPAQDEGTDYAVTVSSQPTGQTCTVGNGTGTNITANITNVAVTCVDDAAPVVTSYTGLLPSGATGTLSFTSTDAACTFAVQPEFLDTVNPAPPASILLVDGVISFTVSACTPGATVTLTMDYGVALPIGSNFWKSGTPWYRLPATVAGATVTFSITDGGLGDADGLANGTIVDPSGAATSVPVPRAGPASATPVPTMSVWGLGVLIALMGLIGFWQVKSNLWIRRA